MGKGELEMKNILETKKLEGMGLTSQRYAPDGLSCRKYL